MKEFQSTTGGRHVYNSDFKNLQELALAMQEIFRACGGNFVISGCNVTISNNTATVSDGYVYIDGRIRTVSGASNLSTSNLYIVAAQTEGDVIPYADGGNANQYINYYAEVKNATSVSEANILYDTVNKTFPNLATTFFNYYSVCKLTSAEQVINKLTVSQSLTASNSFNAFGGVVLDSSDNGISTDDNGISVKIGNYTFVFDNGGAITVKQNSNVLFSFSNGSGAGTVTYENIVVSQDLKANKIYVGGIDIADKLVPLGCIQMWAGAVDKLPDNYKLCDGSVLLKEDYADLFGVIGYTFCRPAHTPGIFDESFNLPDLRGRFIVGYNANNEEYSTIGNTGGEAKHTLTISEMPTHTHSFDDFYYIENKENANYAHKILGRIKNLAENFCGSAVTDYDNNAMLYINHDSDSNGGNSTHENRPPFYTLAYIMRVK